MYVRAASFDLDAARRDAEAAIAGEQLEQLLADELAAPAAQRADVGLGPATPGGDDDRREIGPRRDQLVGQAGCLGTRAHERLGERDRRAVHRVGREPLALVEPDRLGGAAAFQRGEDVLRTTPDHVRAGAADLGELLRVARGALREL